MSLADIENQLLSFIQSNICITFFVSDGGYLPSSMDQTAQYRSAFYDTSIKFDITTCWNLIDERRDVACTTDLFQLIPALKFVTNRNEISRCMFFIKLQDHFINRMMSVTVEVISIQKIRHLNDGFRINNDTA